VSRRDEPAPAVGASAAGGPRGVRMFTAIEAVAVLCLLVYLVTTAAYVGEPLLDQHAFRQCQTAISVPWLAADLDPRRMLVYETPILGAPWRVPFEFPLYQWLAAIVVRLTGWPVGQSCRIVAAVFHLACLWPLWRIVRTCGGTERLWTLLASLFLLAPVLHHWSRAALIETTAVFFSLEYLAAMVAWSRRPAPWRLAAAAAAAVPAVLVKVTTFPPFAVAAGIACLLAEWPRYRAAGRLVPAAVRLLPAVVPLAVALACLVPWLADADAVKRLNPIAASTTSAALGAWNYGTLIQKLSPQLWVGTVLLRAVPEAIGWPGLLVLGAGLVAADRRARLVAGGLTGLFLLPFVLFTNLHMVHDYYQVANAPWLVAALAVVVESLSKRLPQPAWIGLVLLCLGGQACESLRFYLPMEQIDFSRDARLAVARRLKSELDRDDVAVFVGFDWSPEIAFYAERRAVYIPRMVSCDTLASIAADPARVTAGRRIGAMVVWVNNDNMAVQSPEDETKNKLSFQWVARFASGGRGEQINDYLMWFGR